MKKIYFLLITLLFNYTPVYAGYTADGGIRGEAAMRGYIVAAPCSIETENQYQYIDYDSISTEAINSYKTKKENRKLIKIKLNNCISEYDKGNNKGIKIEFFAPQDTYTDAIKLSGPKSGVLLYIYDLKNELLIPNKPYSISDSSIYFDSKTKTNFLRYETEINTFDKNIEPGDYFVTIKFNVSYD
ncbi:fimbrial protein [Providencia rettgeri]|uniref:fimbrial protein n=1 Tax=Providencia rettgeri TaxID=587 RepID=UPI00029C3797|nr:fimbrial protein [Providencia rettgeri]EKT53822.1 fimbrial subunit [Providencia rettgeri Dmel1]